MDRKKPENTAKQAQAKGGARRLLTEAAVLGTSGMVENMEAEGQRQLCGSGKVCLPSKMATECRARLETWGVIFPEINANWDDQVLGPADLPDGWEIKATGHSMHCDLVDGLGRLRAVIFYKAAFYDRNGYTQTRNRFRATVDQAYPDDYETGGNIKLTPVIFDGNVLIWSGACEIATYEARDRITEVADAKLAELFPGAGDFQADWDAATEPPKPVL